MMVFRRKSNKKKKHIDRVALIQRSLIQYLILRFFINRSRSSRENTNQKHKQQSISIDLFDQDL